MRKLIGILIVVFMYIAIFIAMYFTIGLRQAIIAFSIAFGVITLTTIAGFLISSDK